MRGILLYSIPIERWYSLWIAEAGCRTLCQNWYSPPAARDRYCLRVWLHRLSPAIVVSFTRSARCCPSWGFRRLRSNYSKLWALPQLALARSRFRQPGDRVRRRSISSSSSVLGSCVLPFCSTRRSARKVCCRPIYLYPMALSFIVTGSGLEMVSRSPGIGLPEYHAGLGLGELSSLRWIKDRNLRNLLRRASPPSLAGPPASSMAMFLAGLRGVEQRDHQGGTASTGRPPRGASTGGSSFRLMRPVFLSAFVVLAHLAIKSL